MIPISFFLGFEHPEVTINTKKFLKQTFKKFDLTKEIAQNISTISPLDVAKVTQVLNEKEGIKSEFIEIKANSFSLFEKKIISIPKNHRTAKLDVFSSDEKSEIKVYLRNGTLIENNKVKVLKNLPNNFIFGHQNGGLITYFTTNKYSFAYLTQKKDDCYYVSIINLTLDKSILDSKCLPDPNKVDFNGTGGAYFKNDKTLLLGIGAPETDSEKIANLAQIEDSIFGKFLVFDPKDLDNDNNNFKIFSLGHRNPQGIIYKNNNYYSIEHGPRGGDEINKIEYLGNYGWPKISYGTKYIKATKEGLDNPQHAYREFDSIPNHYEPVFTFLPAIAPSDIINCPQNLEKYYPKNMCLMALTLKAKSIIIILFDDIGNKVVSVEKIKLNKRLRHFGRNSLGELYVDRENQFFISSDNDGIYSIYFDKFW